MLPTKRKLVPILALVLMAVAIIIPVIYVASGPNNFFLQTSRNPSSTAPSQGSSGTEPSTGSNNVSSNTSTNQGITGSNTGVAVTTTNASAGGSTSYPTDVQISASSTSDPSQIQVTATISSTTGQALPNKITVHFYFYSNNYVQFDQVITIKTGGQTSVTTTFMVPVVQGVTSYLVDSLVFGPQHVVIGDPRAMLNW